MDENKSLEKHKYLSDLYKNDPEEFERVTNKMIEDCIKNSPKKYQFKLKVLQSRWNNHVKKGNTPHNRLVLAKDMFFEQFFNKFQPGLQLTQRD